MKTKTNKNITAPIPLRIDATCESRYSERHKLKTGRRTKKKETVAGFAMPNKRSFARATERGSGRLLPIGPSGSAWAWECHVFRLVNLLFLGLFFIPAAFSVANADDALLKAFLSNLNLGANPSYKSQTIQYKHNGAAYAANIKVTTSCVNVVTGKNLDNYNEIKDIGYGFDSTSNQITLLSAEDWLCASKIRIKAHLGEAETFKLRRCETTKVKPKGTSLAVNADISYSDCTEEGPTFHESCDYRGGNQTLGTGNYTKA